MVDRDHMLISRNGPYFNYLVYHLVESAAGRTPMAYADYPAAPVPTAAKRPACGAPGCAVGRHGHRLCPGCGATACATRDPGSPGGRPRPSSPLGEAGWEDVGFHRPLAGFLFLLAIGLVLFIVLMIYQQVVLLRHSAALDPGARRMVADRQLFQRLLGAVRLGDQHRLCQVFRQYRVGDRRGGIKYASSLCGGRRSPAPWQLGVVALVAAFLLPGTASGFYELLPGRHALIQFPGFLAVFQ